jgi:hypothetical protein
MLILFQHVALKIQKQSVPLFEKTKVQTFINQETNNYRFIYMNKIGDQYPAKTDCHCWWCRYPFETQPLGIPISKVVGVDKTYYEMEGNFCSFECCFTFLKDHAKSSMLLCYDNSKKLLLELYHSFGHEGFIKDAGDWKLLEKVGSGSVTIEQFRSGLMAFHRAPDVCCIPHIVKYNLSKKT